MFTCQEMRQRPACLRHDDAWKVANRRSLVLDDMSTNLQIGHVTPEEIQEGFSGRWAAGQSPRVDNYKIWGICSGKQVPVAGAIQVISTFLADQQQSCVCGCRLNNVCRSNRIITKKKKKETIIIWITLQEARVVYII